MKTRKIGSFSGISAFALLSSPLVFGVAHAQETLAGLGAASAMGASLGAAAAGSAINGAKVPRKAGSTENELIDEAGNAGAVQGVTGADGTGGAAAVAVAPPAQLYGLNVRKAVSELRRTPTVATAKGGLPKRRESKVARQRRIARLSPSARKKAVQSKYKIAPRGWLSRYLPQDRYKFGKDWMFVSTEDSSYYFKPQALASRKFNPNRVIGFHTWQDAMLAGYKPDPLSKPEPAPQILRLSTQARGDNYYRFVGYVYSGQVNAAAFDATYRYTQLVATKLKTHPDARYRVSETLDYIFAATVDGNPSLVPGYVGRQVFPRTTTANTGAEGGAPQFPGMPNAAGVGQNEGAPGPPPNAEPRAEEFNQFRTNAGNMANVPANR